MRYIIPTTKRYDNTYACKAIIQVENSSRSGGPGGWTVGGWDETQRGRLVFGGPLLSGPVAYFYGLPACISTDGGTAKEIAEAKAKGLFFEVKMGDTLVIDDHDYIINLRAGFPTLTPEF